MKTIRLTLALIAISVSIILAQGTAGTNAKYEYRYLIDMPTAGILNKGFVGVTSDVLPGGDLIEKIEVGVFDNVSFGISYGGQNLIGAGSPIWYKYPGVNIRVRLMNESVTMPALTLGFDSQGKGEYFDSTSRYAIKSPGFFAAISKNFAFMGYLSLHGTVNYSLESKDGDDFVDLQVGAEKTIGDNVSIIGEYDFAFNDNATKYFGSGNGYLNIGVRWSIGSGFTLGFDLRDLLNNKKWSPTTADRALRLEYIKSIF
ncbi:MAG: hypothetical protein ACYCVH_05905 [Ignavibacteriaceae bacterium]